MPINIRLFHFQFLILVLSISFSLGYIVFNIQHQTELRRIQGIAAGEMQQFVIQIEAEFADKFLALQRMAQRHAVSPYTTISWQYDAEHYVNDWKSWRAILWIPHQAGKVLSESQDYFDQLKAVQADVLHNIQQNKDNQREHFVMFHADHADLISIIICEQYLNQPCDYFTGTLSLSEMVVNLLKRNHLFDSYLLDIKLDDKSIVTTLPKNDASDALIGSPIELIFSLDNVRLLLQARPTLHYIQSMETILPIFEGFFMTTILMALMYGGLLIYTLRYKSDKLVMREVQYRSIYLRYKKFLEVVGEAVFGIDRNGIITYANPAACQLTGKSKHELRGSLMSALFNHHADFYSFSLLTTSTSNPSTREIVKITRDNGAILYLKYIATRFEEVADDGTNVVIIMEDITNSENMKFDLIDLANNDVLTGLYNRRYFHIIVSQELQKRRNSANSMALMYIDIDRFKSINDLYGHETGDLILKTFSTTLIHCVRREDVVARLSGDEFAVLFKYSSLEELDKIAQKLLKEIRHPVQIDYISLKFTVSIGIAVALEGELDANELLLRADVALYRAKNNNKNTYRFFDKETSIWLKRKTQLETAILYAVDNQKLSLFYQLRYCLSTMRVCGAEALVRFPILPIDIDDDDQPDTQHCIETAENIGAIESIGNYVINQVFKDIRHLLDNNMLTENERISINVSSKQLLNPGFVKYFTGLTNVFNLSSANIEIEVTESCFIRNKSIQVQSLRKLKQYGYSIAIDDFGSGYSSFGYLQNLPIDVVKIDKCFINEIDLDPKKQTIVKAIVDLAHGLGFQVVAEGVETYQQAEIIMALGFDQLQGFLFSKPESADYTISHWGLYAQSLSFDLIPDTAP